MMHAKALADVADLVVKGCCPGVRVYPYHLSIIYTIITNSFGDVWGIDAACASSSIHVHG